MRKKSWIIQEHDDLDTVNHLMEKLGVSKPIANLLYQRGIKNFDEAKSFFRPELNQLHDPFLMKDMEFAVERISRAIHVREKILIYGDYDVDGTTSVSLLYLFLSNFYTNIAFYIPDRYQEGYGISYQGIDYAYSNNFSLIISLDCGIKANEQVKYAKEKNIDFIICDHHTPGGSLPNAVAVLDPKRQDCHYPYKELSGCGVGFKLAQAYCIKYQVNLDVLYQYIDLVAVSIGADIVPITGENRVLAYYGIKKLNNNPLPGLRAILELTGRNKNISINEVVFIIAPRINAAGRMKSANNAVKLLIAKSKEEAFKYAELVNKFNSERKEIDEEITQQAVKLIDDHEDEINKKTTVLFRPDWHKGVIGIVASRLIEKYYYRPTIILTFSNGKITGSARSVAGYNIYEAINECSELLEQFGGHKYAAGLTLDLKNLPAFKEKFEDIVSSTIRPDQLTPHIKIDTELMLNEITSKFYSVLKQFAPFGPGNMYPVFKTPHVMELGTAKILKDSHLKFTASQESSSGISFSAIAFQQKMHYENLTKGKPFNICYTLEENTWKGNTTLQLNIKDIKTLSI